MSNPAAISPLENYLPLSSARPLGTLIPRNLSFETKQALYNIAKVRGDLDEWVRDQLFYPSKEALW